MNAERRLEIAKMYPTTEYWRNISCNSIVYVAEVREDGMLLLRHVNGASSLCYYTDFPDLFVHHTSIVTKPKPAEVPQESVKLDAGKAPWHLLPVEAMEDLVDVFNYGLGKYGSRNWEHPGFVYSRLFSATMRHLWAWWGGEDIDKESGKHHLMHAASCILFLQQYHHTGAGKDDRHEGPKRA